MNYALKLDNVCKTYETSDFLLDNVSFEVPMGSLGRMVLVRQQP